MKKLLTILLVLISFSSFAQFEAGEYVNSDTSKIKGSSIIYPHADSVEQFYYSKMRDPSEPLDGVNLRTLFDRLASLDTLGLNVSDLVSGTQIINAGETQIFFPSAFDSTNVVVVPFVRRISDDAVIDFTINDIDSLGFDVVVWDNNCKLQYVASQKITHSSDIFKESIYSGDSTYLKSHVRNDFDLDSTNEIQDLSGLVPFEGAGQDVDLGANSISTDTVKIDGVPLLLNTFKQGNLGGAGNIFYSTGASSQPTSGTVNQVIGGDLLSINYLPKWDENKLANSIINVSGTDGVQISTFKGANSVGNNIFIGGGGQNCIGEVGATNKGSSNTVNGINALFNNTTGSNNSVGAGVNALRYNTTGSFNSVGAGVNALFSNTTGSFNSVGAGTYALFSNTIGSFNTGIGHNCGRFLSNGSSPNENSNNSIFIGAGTKALSLNGINEIVIGYNAIGNGTNSVTLGNTEIAKTILRGKVGINQNNPSEALDVNGNLIADTIKARADIIVTGEIYDEINHLYGMIYDSTITLSLTQNIWQQVTNATKTLYSTAEQDGITISSDTIVFSKAGGYDVYFEFNCTGINSKDYHYRILQKNGTTTVRSYNKYASTGTKVVRNEKAYIHVVAGSKVWCEIMSPSSAPGNVTIQGAKVYAMQCYLEK